MPAVVRVGSVGAGTGALTRPGMDDFYPGMQVNIAPVEETIVRSSYFANGSSIGSLPVAMTIPLVAVTSSPLSTATVVGVLVEVPVMLSLVRFSNRTRHWFPSNSSC